ncbi:MAG: dihydropteroate synthase [Deltaproteobacteria bacterium]|nr:dihydropteroate synthase [Deltaproteobacteria bacterium]
MIIIGEKINGTRKKVAEAIKGRDSDFIRALAVEQTKAGSTYLDVNAGTAPSREPEDMVWLIENVQAASDLPICLDSANPKALRAGLEMVDKTPIINSLSGEKARMDGVLPLALEYGTNLVILALDDVVGIPDTGSRRLEIIDRLTAMALKGGLGEDQLYVDPLVTAISTGTENATITLETIRAVRQAYPAAHITSGLSNISYGMPLRGIINRTFLAMCVAAGLDSVIADPNDCALLETTMAAEMLMGRDRFCMGFNKAYRAGRIGPQSK